MVQFVGELYLSRTDPEGIDREGRREGSSAEKLTSEGAPLPSVRSIFVPS